MLIEITKQSLIGYEISQIEDGLYVLFRELVEEKEDSLVVDEYSIVANCSKAIVIENIEFYKSKAKQQEIVKKRIQAQKNLNDTDWVEVQLNRYALVYGVDSEEYKAKLESRKELLSQRMEWETIVRGTE